jgi:iron complex outermembrane receptor protein
MQGTAQRGRLSLASSLTLVDSRVLRLAEGYTGDLNAGDRMFDVPAQTLSLSASWSGARWFGTVTASRAFDWVDYDRLALARGLGNVDRRSRDFVGDRLRDYWRVYNGATRLRASGTRTLARGLSLVVTGENLLDLQRGEPDNATIVPGRTITGGVRIAF